MQNKLHKTHKKKFKKEIKYSQTSLRQISMDHQNLFGLN